MTRLAVICLALSLPVWANAQTNSVAQSIGRYLSTLDSAQQFSGTVLVARGSEVLFEQSYGRSGVDGSTKNTPATLFAVASITKPLTGIATRLLAERGVLGLEDPVARWIPEFPQGSRITITHLLGHRSGIPHRVTTLSDEQKPQSAESMTQLIGRAPLMFEPGAQRVYSSAGYSLLARVLERASDKSFATLLRELVLQPAEAANAIDATETPGSQPRAKGHFWTPDGPLAAPEKQLSFLVGAGSLWATPRDLFKVIRRIVDGGYGATATAGARTPNGAIQWTGFSNGFQTIVSYDPATEVTIVVVGNVLTGAAEWIVRDVPRLVAGQTISAPSVPRYTAVIPSEAQRQRTEGVYNFGGNEQQLAFVRPSMALLGGEYALIAINDSTFFAPQNYAEVRIARAVDGRVTSLDFVGQGGFTIRRVR